MIRALWSAVGAMCGGDPVGCGPEWVVHRVSVGPVLLERLKILAAFRGQALSACAHDAILAFAAEAGAPFPATSLEIDTPRRPVLGTPWGANGMPQVWCKIPRSHCAHLAELRKRTGAATMYEVWRRALALWVDAEGVRARPDLPKG